MWPFDRLFRRQETRKSPTSWDLMTTYGSFAMTGYGSPEAAHAELAVAHRCTQLIAETLASVPLHLFRDTAGVRERAGDHPLYRVLHDDANPHLTAFEAREMLLRSVLMFGNAVAEIERNGRGQVVALTPIPFGCVTVESLADRSLRYRISEPGRPSRVLLDSEVLHVRYASPDGVLGKSPLELTGGVVALAMRQARTARVQAERGLVPPGAFGLGEDVKALSEPAFQRLKSQLEAMMRSFADTGKPLVLEGGMKWQPMGSSAADAQFVEARRLGLQDVARIYGVPASVVGLSDRPTYGSVEQEHRALVSQCLAPHARRLESAMMRALLTGEGRRSHLIEHDLAGLLRGDLPTRYSAYATGITNGFMSPNEARRIENLPPREGGDEFLRPLNMQPNTSEADGAGA